MRTTAASLARVSWWNHQMEEDPLFLFSRVIHLEGEVLGFFFLIGRHYDFVLFQFSRVQTSTSFLEFCPLGLKSIFLMEILKRATILADFWFEMKQRRPDTRVRPAQGRLPCVRDDLLCLIEIFKFSCGRKNSHLHCDILCVFPCCICVCFFCVCLVCRVTVDGRSVACCSYFLLL